MTAPKMSVEAFHFELRIMIRGFASFWKYQHDQRPTQYPAEMTMDEWHGQFQAFYEDVLDEQFNAIQPQWDERKGDAKRGRNGD